MGIVRSLTMSKRQIKNTKQMTLDSETALSFVCDEVLLLPVSKYIHFPAYRRMDAVLFAHGEPLVRLKYGGDVMFIEPSNRSFKIDVAVKNNLTRIFPTFGRIRVDWDGCDLHITRLPGDDETV